MPKLLSRSLPFAGCLALLGAAVNARAQNAVTSVSYKNGNVEIASTQPPNFTTLTMSDPPRLVVDIANAVFRGVPPEIPVNDGKLTSIKNVSYGQGNAAVARVLIGLTKELDTDIATNGNTLIVKLNGPPAVAEDDLGEGPPPAAAQPPPSAPVAAAPTPAPPKPSETVASAPPPTGGMMDPDSADDQAAAPPPAAAAPPPPEPVAAAAPPPPATPPAPPASEDGDDVGAPPPSANAPPAALPVAAAPAPTPQAPVSATPVEVSSRRKRLAWLGFRPTDSQVFIRTNEPVNYSVSEGPGGTVLVRIENTQIRRQNDRRKLDTHFFSTPVASIVARQVRRDVVVEIRLKTHTSYQAVQRGPEVDLSFGAPGSVALEAAPVPQG